MSRVPRIAATPAILNNVLSDTLFSFRSLLCLREAFELRQNLLARCPGIRSGEPTDDLADGPVGELDVIVETEPTAIWRRLDFPPLIVALEEVAGILVSGQVGMKFPRYLSHLGLRQGQSSVCPCK